ncbi:hypothetical protein [Arthrobacter alpinus]|nr:hypothetical protein [Arthrobacter alpinus]
MRDSVDQHGQSTPEAFVRRSCEDFSTKLCDVRELYGIDSAALGA